MSRLQTLYWRLQSALSIMDRVNKNSQKYKAALRDAIIAQNAIWEIEGSDKRI